MPTPLDNLAGKKFGRWHVLGLNPQRSKTRAVFWNCVCSCGTFGLVRSDTLRMGISLSCGCLARELAAERCRTHDGSYSLLYKLWCGMRLRCENPRDLRYRFYGAKGVRVCEPWKSFEVFREWALANRYREGLSIDRINPRGHYEASNCEWVTRSENSRRSCITRRANVV